MHVLHIIIQNITALHVNLSKLSAVQCIHSIADIAYI